MKLKNYRLFCWFLPPVLLAFGFIFARFAGQSEPFEEQIIAYVMVVVCVVSLVVLVGSVFSYSYFRQLWAEKRVLRDLEFMARRSDRFAWDNMKLRIVDCIYRFHVPWRDEDEEDISLWMTDAYWQRNKSPFLDKLKNEGLVNICNIKTILSLRPIYFLHRNVGGMDEKSEIVLSIVARVQNYLAERSSGELIEGSKDFLDVQTVWSFEMVNGSWLIANIEEKDVLPDYINHADDLPDIEDTLLKPVKVMFPAE